MKPRFAAIAAILLAQAIPVFASPPLVERLDRHERLLADGAGPPDHDGSSWRLDPLPAIPPPAGCVPAAPPETLLAEPRVDLFRCQAGFAKTLVGDGGDGSRWTRELRHRSGPHTIELYVGSANAQAITLDTMEVIDPASGRTLKFAPMKLIDTPPRAMPIVRVSGALACPPDGGDCFGAIGEGDPAGLLRINRDGNVSVLEKPQTRWFAPIVITDIQIAGDRVLLAEEWLYRGSKWVRFAVVDAVTGKRLFEERHGEDHVAGSPRIVSGPAGEIAFHYRDATIGRKVMVRYRLARRAD